MVKIKHLIYNSYFLATFVSLPFILYLYLSVSKYRIEEVATSQVPGNVLVYYNDLNGDGVSEKITLESNTLNELCLKIYNPAHQGQFNSDVRRISQLSHCIFGDINNDGNNEIFFLGEKDSAVYLTVFDYRTRSFESFFVDSVKAYGTGDYGIRINDIRDMDLDGHNDVIISISGYFSLYPRSLYLISPAVGKRVKTPFTGTMLHDNMVCDIDEDHYPEILVNNFAYRNQTSTVPVTDSCSWLIVFDHQLQFKFEPVKISCHKSHFSVVPFHAENKTFLCGISENVGELEIPDQLMLISPEGEVLLQKPIEKGDPASGFRLQVIHSPDNNKLFLLHRDGTLSRLNKNLDIKKYRKRKFLANTRQTFLDLNGDGIPEQAFRKIDQNQWIFTDLHFNHPVVWGNGMDPGGVHFTPVFRGGKKGTLFVQSGTRTAELGYGMNPLWYGQYLIFAGIWGFFWLLIWIISKIQLQQMKQQLAVQEQMNDLQYRVVTSQFSPHYTFNVLTAISSEIYRTNPDLYDYIMKFSNQLRYLYAERSELSRTLKDEIDFCRDYLDIQKIRYAGRFDYKVTIDEEGCLDVIIPKMLVFTFVENALKHGLRPVLSGGMIDLSVQLTERGISIYISDNGIGRKAAADYLKENPYYSTGRGLELLEKLVKQLNNKGQNKIAWEIIDLAENGQTGTEVKILLLQ